MSENQKNTSEISATPESNQDILSRQPASVQDIIKNDFILSKNLDQITNPKEFFEKLAQSAHIFEQTDNLAAQKTFLEQSLKGLGYWQYTKDGRDFSSLNETDVDGLSDSDFDTYNKWKIAQKKEAVVSKKAEDAQLDQAVVSLNQGIAQKKEAVVSKKAEDAQLDQAVVSLDQGITQKKEAAIAREKEIYPVVSLHVKKAQNALSSSGNSSIEREVIKTRMNDQNPINQELLKSWKSPEEIKDPKYDDMRRASIMIGIVNDPRELAKFKEQGWMRDEMNFMNSINEIKKLGVVPSQVNLENVSAHIDSRFPRSESTEQAKWEIARSIASGGVASIYYDGKGEKYTLIDKDGKTSKEVFMNPPRISIRESTLSYEFPIYKDKDKSGSGSYLISKIPTGTI